LQTQAKKQLDQKPAQWLEDLLAAALAVATWKRGKVFLELFSGSGRVGQAVKMKGGAVIFFDIEEDPRFDLTRSDVQGVLWLWVGRGVVWGAWLGTCCVTWSRASWSKGPGWYNSYRSQENLWGELSKLSPKAKAKAILGNAMAIFSIKFLEAIGNQPLAVAALENPAESVLFKLPEFQAMERRFPKKAFRTTVDYCQYGARWKKPTTIFWMNALRSLAPNKVCVTKGGRCSRTKQRHLKLGQGRCHPTSGKRLTLCAQPYPKCLANKFAQCLLMSSHG